MESDAEDSDWRDSHIHTLAHKARGTWTRADWRYSNRFLDGLRATAAALGERIKALEMEIRRLQAEVDEGTVDSIEGQQRLAALGRAMTAAAAIPPVTMPSPGPCTPECPWADVPMT